MHERAIGPGSDPALRGAANGDGASDLARLTAHWGRRGSRTLLVSPFGRTHVVRGRLRTADGAPIANAAIDVVSKTTAVNARELGKRVGPRTGNDGSWYLVLPRRVSSRDVTFRYRSHVNDTIASATASVRLRVRAGLRLAIHPRRARQGQAIRFSGRLLGGPLPRGGKQVVLMARASRGAWVRFNVVRTDRRGRFRTTLPLPAARCGAVPVPGAEPQRGRLPVPRGRLERRQGPQGLREPETGLEPVTPALQERCSTS